MFILSIKNCYKGIFQYDTLPLPYRQNKMKYLITTKTSATPVLEKKALFFPHSQTPQQTRKTTLPVLIPEEEKINLKFYFCTSLWCVKRFYEGLYKTIWGTTKKCKTNHLCCLKLTVSVTQFLSNLIGNMLMLVESVKKYYPVQIHKAWHWVWHLISLIILF